jgi:hypothetical protein
MVVDFLRGTFTSDGNEVEKGSAGLFCIILLWSIFITVPKNKLWLTITPSEVLKFTFYNHL